MVIGGMEDDETGKGQGMLGFSILPVSQGWLVRGQVCPPSSETLNSPPPLDLLVGVQTSCYFFLLKIPCLPAPNVQLTNASFLCFSLQQNSLKEGSGSPPPILHPLTWLR